jgi:hypothetical protein
MRGTGYVVEFRETSHQKLGRLRVPERITLECIEDLARACCAQPTLEPRIGVLCERMT